MLTSGFTPVCLEGGFTNAVYVPENRDPAKKLPLVIFLHGAGERGSDPELLFVHGPFKLIRQGFAPDFICIAPQCPEGAHWNDKTELLKVFIDGAIEKYNADPDRIYITGISMGGFGTWAMLARWSDFFAAAVPVCGGGMPWTADSICPVPVWAFHGALDDVVFPEESMKMVDAVNAAGGNARFTLYPDWAHDSWEPAYTDDELYRFLTMQDGCN